MSAGDKPLPREHFRQVAARLVEHAFEEYQRWQAGDGDARMFVDWVRDEVAAYVKQKVCCVCGGPCLPDPPPGPERWHWGPDGQHCHFRCADEFRRRHPGRLP